MSDDLAPPSFRPRRRHWPYAVVACLVVLAVAVFVASRIQLNWYALTPGSAQPVAPLIKVPPGKGSQVNGSILLTDVYVTQLSALDYLGYRLNGDAQLVSSGELLGPYTPPDQLTAQGYIEMAQSQASAKAAAFRRLNYAVPEHDAGALVFAVEQRSPARDVLAVGDIVTAVAGTATPTDCAFVSALHDRSPGQQVNLTVQQTTITPDGRLVPGATKTTPVRLAKPPPGTVSTPCPGVSGPPRSYLGVAVETQQDFTYPFPVSVDTSQIGGPSAGLAMTLGLLDKLSGGDLTGGKKIAATGTIDAQGDVGDVGGVAQKTVAVERAGAGVFFVPSGEYGAAKSKDVASLHIYPVSTLGQVLSVLGRLGGRVPPTA